MSGVNECAIDWVRGDTYAGVTAYASSRLKGRVEKLAELYPDNVQIVRRNEDGSIFAHIPIKWVKIGRPRTVSDEQRQAASDRLRVYQQSRKEHDSEDDEDYCEDEEEE